MNRFVDSLYAFFIISDRYPPRSRILIEILRDRSKYLSARCYMVTVIISHHCYGWEERMLVGFYLVLLNFISSKEMFESKTNGILPNCIDCNHNSQLR